MSVVINRKWAMPSRHTFTIKPIRELLDRYFTTIGWADPFAGEHSMAEFTNDLNPNKPTKYHLHCEEFAEVVPGPLVGVLFDPPYSPRQVKECYEEIGLKTLNKDCQGFNTTKRILADKVVSGGVAICCGWNSNGFGKKLGFELIELLIVAHGSNHNDTIVTVEIKK
jgi:hypothetical protein